MCRTRVGLVGLERVPVREGTALFDAHGRRLGQVTSGTLAPTVNQPIAMAYLPADHAISRPMRSTPKCAARSCPCA